MVSALASSPVDPTSGHWEGVNPTRRYRFFRPRQAAWGTGTAAGSVNKGTLYLFNNSPNQWLIVRSLFMIPQTGNDVIQVGQVQGVGAATLVGTVQPFVSDAQTLPGLIYKADVATIANASLQVAVVVGANPITPIWPMFAIQMGWALYMQNTVGHDQITGSFLWECVYPDELDFFW